MTQESTDKLGELIVHTDGGARGNPGPAGIGVVIEKDGKIIHEFGKTIREATNNVAEYTAVVEALNWLIQNESRITYHISHITFYLDSQLVVNQLNGLWKIKNADLRNLMIKIRELEQQVGGVITYASIPREQNQRADFLVNQALDGS